MITIKQFLDVINYQVTDADNWIGYKELAIMLSTWDGDQNGRSMDIVFSPESQQVFAVHVHDYKNARSYRRQIAGFNDDKEAWDGVDYIDLESDDDLLEKMSAIFNYEPYDDRILIPLNGLSDDVLFVLMKAAHENDMTLNQYMEKCLRETIDSLKIGEKNV